MLLMQLKIPDLKLQIKRKKTVFFSVSSDDSNHHNEIKNMSLTNQDKRYFKHKLLHFKSISIIAD